MKLINYFIIVGLILLAFGISCDSKDPVIPNEEELITTLILTLTPENGGPDLIFSFRDLDGDGGNSPTITTEMLTANSFYSGSLELLNETVAPTDDITVEVEEEGHAHQFFFLVSSSLNLEVSYEDQDSNGDPVGLNTRLISGDTSSGTLIVTLRHEPQKSAIGVSNGDITNAGGETDIEVTFDITLQ